jgi:hypothetical protein
VGGILKQCWVLLEWECGNKLGGGWEFIISSSLIEFFWGNGCGGMVGRERHYGDW